jgi:hypothetical protein
MFSTKRKLRRLTHIIASETVLALFVASFYLPSDEDLYKYYLPFTQSCFECGFNPWHAMWILLPIRLIPVSVILPVWVLVSTIGVYWGALKLDVNPALGFLCFPMLGMLWLGQIDAVILIGLMLALISPSPYVRGFGLLLASIKPQISGIPTLIFLWYDHEHFKTLLIPALFFAATTVAWGVDWPIRWLLSDPEPSPHVWRMGNLYPAGMIAFAAIFLVKGLREKIVVSLYAAAIGLPWFGSYSHMIFLAFFMPWWALPLSWAWALATPSMGDYALRLTWLLPLGLLIYKVTPVVKSWRAARQNPSETTGQTVEDNAP